MLGKQGALSISALDDTKTKWLKSFKSGNQAIKHSIITYQGVEYKSQNEDELSESDMMFSSSLKGNFPVNNKRVPFVSAQFLAKVQGNNVINFTYDLNYPSNPRRDVESENEGNEEGAIKGGEDLMQYIWLNNNMNKLEPIIHNVLDPQQKDKMEYEFVTNNIEKLRDGLVK